MIMIIIISMKGEIKLTLAMVPLGEKRVILNVRCKDDMKRHLQDMGIVRGERVQVLGENQSGLILLIKDAKIALNRGLASLIIVE